MKKFLMLIFISVTTVFAQQNSSESTAQMKVSAANQLNTRYSSFSPATIIETDTIPESSKDLDVDEDEDLTSSNILISLTNRSSKDITVTDMAYVISSGVCGYTKTSITLKPNTTSKDYHMNKAEGIKCLKQIQSNIDGRFGRMQLVDIGSKFDVNKYQQFTTGLYLYPVKLSIIYTSKGSVTKSNKLLYLIFATL